MLKGDILETFIRVLKDVKPNNPILIEGLPGIGNIGRIVAGYLIEELETEKIAELYSPHFLPFVILHEDVARVLKCEFHYYKDPKGKNDLIILIGDSQSGDQEGYGHYEIAEKILDYAEDLGVKKVFTIGGFGTGEIEKDEPMVLGAVNDPKLLEEYKGYGINFEETSLKLGMIVGATGLLLGLSKLRGMDGLCLLGETAGFPILTDPKAGEAVLKILMKILNLDISLEKLEKRVKDMENFLQKIERIQQQALKQMGQEKSDEDELRYIG
ncbi:MAG: proteasome assembly chaperone family protein [Candidatus Aenigmatarchaeota archaeon]|nr:MAG: proteasome assembly chaperone family protein [Candidatus Aenigmarchaeota archaeon]